MTVTSEQVMGLRAEAGWVSPVLPCEPGELRCVFDQRGTWEFLVHPDDAFRYMTFGIVIDGRTFDVAMVGVFPLLNAIQVRVQDPDRETGFVAA